MAVSCNVPPIGDIKCNDVIRKELTSIKVDKNGNAYDSNGNYLGVVNGRTILATKETFWMIENDNK